jgi:hypothetical protein
MGAVAERYRVEGAELLDQMPGRLSVLDDRQWRDLSAHMAHRQAMAEAAVDHRPATQARRPVAPPDREPVPAPAAAQSVGTDQSATAAETAPPEPPGAAPAGGTDVATSALGSWSAPAWSPPVPAAVADSARDGRIGQDVDPPVDGHVDGRESVPETGSTGPARPGLAPDPPPWAS